MTTRPIPILAALAGAASLAGCVSQGPFPSLAPRPAELEEMSQEPVRAAPEIPADAALRARIAALAAEANVGARNFDAGYGAASAAARAPGAAGSERWIAAQQARSRLEASRAQTTHALAELDRLRLAQADRPTNAADQAALDDAVAQAERIAADQQARIDRLRRD